MQSSNNQGLALERLPDVMSRTGKTRSSIYRDIQDEMLISAWK
jgi:predicted DNA-binding transcriptional regulator AlpA